MKRFPIKLTVLFSIVVTVIITGSSLMFAALALALSDMGYMEPSRGMIPILLMFFASLLSSLVVSFIVMRRLLSPIYRLNQSMKEVADGNFTVRLSETKNADEVKEMNRSFNRMVKELGNTEIFRNDFISNVSHEFKTPISAIEGYVTLLQDKGISEEEREIYTKSILRSTKRLSSLANNILQLSKLENQELHYEESNFSLDEQIRQIVLMYELQWTEKNIHLEIDMDTVYIRGNKSMMYQVWSNIFMNAVKFSEPGGTISIDARVIYDDELGEAAKVSFIDNGIGISKEQQKHIFEKFYQADESHTAEGNGLGLALSKQIVKMHNGRIDVQSRQGEGSEFTIFLPVVQ